LVLAIGGIGEERMAKRYLVGEEKDGDLVVDYGPDFSLPIPPLPSPSVKKVWLPMRHPAIFKAVSNMDGWGKPTTANITIPCRFIAESGNKRTRQGDEIQYHARVFLPNTIAPRPGDFICCQDTNLTLFYNKDLPILDYVRAKLDNSGCLQWWEVLL
jgi:hypothetical protein